ncbi:USP6 N-terminal-like protein isoform X11 [Canis lupus familiaris]|uniref:USP6 N-terminal-like protein isoform X11 n=1 Tax=Canis lupus familiaris TaxID=9615 RepID=UPI0018F2A63A|nr:USP6 N-terminal-like protein isoform X11 [Canis lupus familiaris]
MQEDSETLLALQRPNIVAQYHQGQGAAQPQPPRGQETPPGDPVHGQIDKNAQAMGPLPPQREAAVPGLQGGPAPGAGTGVAAIAERRPGNEGGSPGLLPGHHADRPGRQPDVPQSHHVLGPLRGWEVGYCQGMSEIAAIVLMFLPENAFWALAQLMTDDRHAMHGFFVPGFQKLLRFQAHHQRVLQRALPDLRKHMDEEQMSTGIYTPKWFLQCFLSRTPFSLTLKLWDVYILDGERVLTALAYTILKVHTKSLLKLPLEGLREFLQDSPAQPWALEDEAVLRHLRASMTQLRRMRCDLPPPSGTWSSPRGPSA